MAKPFRITGYLWKSIRVLVVQLESEGRVGRGEAIGIYYRNDTVDPMAAQIEAIRPALQCRLGRSELRSLLPPGGARNALDCAIWDLESKLAGRPAWSLAGLESPRPLVTTFTCGAEDPHDMAKAARAYAHARALKIKLTGEEIDVDRVRAVREARKDVWLGIDANQGFSRSFLERLMPVLVAERVELIEQPLPAGQDDLLDGIRSPIPLAADESVQTADDILALVGRYDVVNIKLDKCGGLTEGLKMARLAISLGLKPMVGNMLGTSLAMAPAFVLGQLCEIVDLDGPALLAKDRNNPVMYLDGTVSCPRSLWG